MLFADIYASAIQASFAQHHATKRFMSMQKQVESVSGTYDMNLGAPRSGKCKCCGSVEFRSRGEISVCTYCRSPA